jgi:hypothetical protein
MPSEPQSPRDLLDAWKRRLRESQFSHYEAAKLLGRYTYFLGIPAVVLSTIVGTSVFASLGKAVDPSLQIAIGLVSVLAAVLAGLQTFLQFPERAEKHRSVAARYGSLRRRIEELIATNTGSFSKEDIAALRGEIDSIAEKAPHVSTRIWKRAEKMLLEKDSPSHGPAIRSSAK